MHTPAEFALPLPRKIASRPVDSTADTIADGGAVPSMKKSWSLRLHSIFVMPDRTMSVVVIQNVKRATYTFYLVQGSSNILHTRIAMQWHSERCLPITVSVASRQESAATYLKRLDPYASHLGFCKFLMQDTLRFTFRVQGLDTNLT